MNTFSKFQKTHKMILEKSMALIMKNGYQKVTIADICKEAGIARPTFYSHFASRESLLEDYFEHKQIFTPQMRDWVLYTMTNWESMIRLQIVYIRGAGEKEDLELFAHYLIYKMTERDDDCTTIFSQETEAAMRELWIKLIDHAQRAGEMENDSDAILLSDVMLSMQHDNLLATILAEPFDCAMKGISTISIAPNGHTSIQFLHPIQEAVSMMTVPSSI